MASEPMMVKTLERALALLSQSRPVFHSEADLQHALAWQLQLVEPTASIRLERRMATTPRVELDVLVRLNDRTIAIELKYPRAALAVELNDESYDLRLGAPDVECYGVVSDLWRIERLLLEGLADEGCVVVISNNRALWERRRNARPALWDAFRLTDGTTLGGRREWRPTEKKWPGPPIELDGTYELRWRPYSTVPSGSGAREFRSLLVPVFDGRRSRDQPVDASVPTVATPATAASATEPSGGLVGVKPASTAERGRIAAKRALADAGFTVREDERRRNRLLVARGELALTIWVAARRGFRYPFWVKTDWQPDEALYVCLVRFDEVTGVPEVYVIPTTVWDSPDGVFVSRDYAGAASPPEWGINLSARNLPTLQQFRLPHHAGPLASQD